VSSNGDEVAKPSRGPEASGGDDAGTSTPDRHQASEPSRAMIFSRAFILLGAAQVGQNLAITMIYTCLGLLVVVRLGLNPSVAGVVIGGLFAVSLASRLAIGGIVDRRGPRRIGIVGAACSGTGALLYAGSAAGIAGDVAIGDLPLVLIPATIILGVGYAASTTSLNTQLAHTVPAGRRGEAVAYYGVFLTVGAGIGSGAGYPLFELVGPAAPFAGAGLAYAWSALLWLTVPHREESTVEIEGRRRLGLERSVLVPAAAMACVLFAQATASAFVPVAGRELGVPNPGVYFIAFSVAALTSRALTGRIADRRGRLATIVPGAILQASGLLLVSVASESLAFVVAGLVVGAGVAMLQSTLQTVTIDLARPERRGAAMATLGASFDVGVIVGSVVAGQLAHVLGYSQLFRVTSLVPLAGLVLLLAWRRLR
jgi:predicted MFS family arabinose efflux permease